MLPSFQKAQKLLNEQWLEKVLAAKAVAFPLALQPPVFSIAEGKRSDLQREDRKIEKFEMQRHSVTVTHSVEDGKGLTLEAFETKAREAGAELGKQMFNMLITKIDEAVLETGNEIKVKRGNLSQEDVLRMLAMGEQSFDESGNPIGQFVAGSEFFEEIKQREAEWAKDDAYQAKKTEIRRQKLEEFNEREARRRLVD